MDSSILTMMQTCRRAIRETLRTDSGRAPCREAVSNGWWLSDIDPGGALVHTPNLRLRPGWRLAGYLSSDGANGNGIVHAVPDGSPTGLDTAVVGSLEIGPDFRWVAPRPPAASDHFMEAIEGDGSGASFVQASILLRELKEFGAQWHGLWWSTHTILGKDPWKSGEALDFMGEISGRDEWKFIGREPPSWEPQVRIEDGSVEVEFLAYSGLGTMRITRFTDHYEPPGMLPDSRQETVCKGPMGYIH